jgi:hypothetical protein
VSRFHLKATKHKSTSYVNVLMIEKPSINLIIAFIIKMNDPFKCPLIT